MLFEEEKLPYELGWRPSTEPITLATLGTMIEELYLANPLALPEGVLVSADTYKVCLLNDTSTRWHPLMRLDRMLWRELTLSLDC